MLPMFSAQSSLLNQLKEKSQIKKEKKERGFGRERLAELSQWS